VAKGPRTRPARRPTATRCGGPTVTECVQLRIRVIALENLVIAMLAQAPERQLVLAREMALHISPRPGYTAHRLILHAAEEMRSLVVRARRFRANAATRVSPTDPPP
jgi:hypothetical protein